MTVGIIGYGRFGRLWAELVTPLVDEVLVFDAHQDLSDISCGKKTSLEDVCQSDLLFLIVPISVLATVSEQIAPLVRPDTIVCDVASVKVRPVEWMSSAFSSTQPLVFTHPLFGPDSVARSGVRGKKMVLLEDSDSQARLLIEELCKKIEVQTFIISAEVHDQQMARSQALVHMIGRGLEPLGLGPQEIATPDYERLLAMAELVQHDTWQLFEDMQRYNPFAVTLRKELLASLQEIDAQLDTSSISI